MYTPRVEDATRLQNDFTYHAPNETQIPRYKEIRDRAHDLAFLLLQNCPPSRELSIALTHIETACFYANASIARNEKT